MGFSGVMMIVSFFNILFYIFLAFIFGMIGLLIISSYYNDIPIYKIIIKYTLLSIPYIILFFQI